MGGTPDRVPLAELGLGSNIIEPFLGRKVRGREDIVGAWMQLGYDYVPVGTTSRARDLGIDNAALGQMQRRMAGTGRAYVNSWADWKQLAWPSLDYLTLLLEADLEGTLRALPNDMKVVLGGGNWFEMAYILLGFEQLCLLTLDDPGLVQAIIDTAAGSCLCLFERALDMGGDHIGAIWLGDDIAHGCGLMVRPEFLRAHVFPWYAKVGALCRAKQIPFIYHSDGNYWPMMDDLIGLGVNAVHPVEPGSMDIREVKTAKQGKLCVIGNIDLHLLATGTPSEVETLTRGRLDQLKPGGGYCLSSSNSLPDYVQFANYIAMVRTALTYGWYT